MRNDQHAGGMGTILFASMPSDLAFAYRNGQLDDNGNVPEKFISDGSGFPCRHCLSDIPAGNPGLLLAWRPFRAKHAYAETGPVFICDDACPNGTIRMSLPPALAARDRFILRGYDQKERIVEGTGMSVKSFDVIEHAGILLNQPAVHSVHVRHSTNNCFLCEIVLEDGA